MDHNLEDPLNLDSAMGVDFETSGDQVVSQTDISLDAGSHETNIPMEFEPIEEHPMLMDAENEQIIGYSDDQFNLQEYGIQQEDDTGANTTVVTSEPSIPHTQEQTMLDIQFDPQAFVSSTPKIEPAQPKLIAVKSAMPPRFTALKKELVVMPRQVAIAPKPPRPRPPAPAPRALALAPRAIVKKVALGSVQGAAPNTVLAQIGKQLVMMPAGSNQKIKLVTSSGGVPNIQYIRAGQGDQAQLIATKNVSGTAKPMLTKLILQGQQSGDPANQPAVLTKLMGASQTTRLVTMTQKTVPISMPNKVLVTSPTKQTVRITKKPQLVEIKSPTQKFIATSQPGIGGTKKVVITATPAQNVIYKTAASVNATAQISKDGAVQGQRTQLHQINVPGKGIQYIRLVTNSNAPRLKPLSATRPAPTIVLTDNKGNVIQMGGEKVQSTQPPPLVISGATLNKLAAKPQQKLVRIAPVGSKPAIAATQTAGRSSQSLLAPLSPAPAPALAPAPAPASAPSPPPEDMDSKAALRALIAEAVGPAEREAEPEPQSPEEAEKSAEGSEAESSYRDKMEQPLIVIPNYLKPQDMPDDYQNKDDGNRYNSFEAQSFNSYQAPPTPQALSESEMVPNELGMRPRKACNCTKSQCLKLYCDCFANGEFCNRCNCTSCHNNLEHEELRQKAIRGCLDRNPNAFRPKIGKTKGGPEIVRRHNKGCNCKRSGCLKNYCECYEAKIACTAMCKCVGCRNVEESLERRRRLDTLRDHVYRPPALPHINFMTTEVIEAVCQCLLAAAGEPAAAAPDPVRDVLDEFSRCLQDIIAAAHHAPLLDESRA